MSTAGLLWVLVGPLLGHVAPADSQVAARAIIVRAIAAQGGEQRLAFPVATHSRCKGTMSFLGNVTFSGETWSQEGNQVRQLLTINGPQIRRVLLILNGANAWLAYDHAQPEMLDPGTLAAVRIENYVDGITNLVPLVHDKSYRLAMADEQIVDGRPVVGVKVAADGKPDVLLYFDRDTGLLCKRMYQSTERGSAKSTSFVSLYSDYRTVKAGDSEEQTLRQAGVASDGPALVRYLEQHSLNNAALDNVQRLIRALGARSFRQREKATADLVALGPSALPFLRKAETDHDLEIVRRARLCVHRIEAEDQPNPAVTGAVIRLIGLRQPPGSAAALLAFAPLAPDAATTREIQTALKALAVKGEKRRLRKALDDPNPARRSVAAAALGQAKPVSEPQRVFLDGLKMPRRIQTFRDHKPSMTYETVSVEYFDHLDKGLFSRPSP